MPCRYASGGLPTAALITGRYPLVQAAAQLYVEMRVSQEKSRLLCDRYVCVKLLIGLHYLPKHSDTCNWRCANGLPPR